MPTVPPARPRLAVEPLEPRLTPALSIRLDFRLDVLGFFDSPGPRAALQASADAISPLLGDALSPITPGGGNVWRVEYDHPGTGQTVRLDNLAVGANEIVVFPVGAPLAGTELGEATSGTVTASGSRGFLADVFGRGQPGAQTTPASDFGPWGGFIAFDPRVRWSFDPAGPPSDRVDFRSVLEHELVHLLGYAGNNGSFRRWTRDGVFEGPNATAAFGRAVPMGGGGHWATGTTSDGRAALMVPSIGTGEVQRLTSLDLAGLKDIGWEVTGVPPPAPVPPPDLAAPLAAPLWPAATTGVAVGAEAGGTGWLLGPTLAVRATGKPDPSATGPARVAAADVTGDGVLDLMLASGPGGPPRVRVLDGATGQQVFAATPFEETFTGGLFVAAGDVDRDGRADLVVTPDRGGGPRVKVYRGRTGLELADFFGIDDPSFRGGARPAVGDVDGDGFADVVVSAGFLGGPRVAGFSGAALAAGRTDRVFADFFAFEPTLRNGAFVAVGDVTGDRRGDLVLGGGPGGGPRVRVADGAMVAAAGGFGSLDGLLTAQVANFFAGSAAGRGGVRVAARDLDGDGRADVVTGSGENDGSRVAGYSGARLAAPDAGLLFAQSVFPTADAGVYVG